MTARQSAPALRGALVLAGATAVVLLPASAEAHLVTTGLGPVYDGISHFLFSPDDLVPVLAMALLAGMNGAAAGRRALFMLVLGWFAGGCAGLVAGSTSLPGSMTAASFLGLGVLTAVDRRLPAGAIGALALAVGGLHGWLNGAGIAAAGREGLGLLGIVGAAFVLAALGAAFAASRRVHRARIALRVAGSWIAAVGLLMLGWSLRGGSA
jgi:hydrogenase/urease accessory protein HupE